MFVRFEIQGLVEMTRSPIQRRVLKGLVDSTWTRRAKKVKFEKSVRRNSATHRAGRSARRL